MVAMYKIIGTGSKGNAVLLFGSILIDIGVRWKHLAPVAKDIKLVLLTHKHGDHFNRVCVSKLADENPLVRWVCCPWMEELLLSAGVSPDRITVLEPTTHNSPGGMARFKGFCTVRPERVKHDAANCCWHIIRELGTDMNYSAFYCTDAESIEHVKAKNYRLYLIEANHTEEDIKARAKDKTAQGEYAYEFRAAHNHLSYEQANEWLMNNAADYSDIVYLHQHIEEA